MRAHRTMLACSLFALLLFAPLSAEAQKVQDYSSRNFLLHTDLSPEEAKELLERQEKMLTLISKYWGQPNRQVIECYVVKDLSNWPPGSIDPRGLQSIQSGAGVTLGVVQSRGNQFQAKATVYAVADRGTPLHESVHAYCTQTFGRTGPVWYSEGMAEMGQYWKENDGSVNAHDIVVKYLQETEPKSLNEIVNGNEVTGDSWQNYAWRWALCHLLANNPNYAPRFRPLGLGLLTNQKVSFEQVYGTMAEEISFEYLFFLEHMETGYRVDLCSWDWKTKFKRPNSTVPLLAKIEAQKGWQPSRVQVQAGETYEFSAEGTWQLSSEGAEFSAAGDETGKGKLVGIIFKDYELSEPFELGGNGTFTAPADGNLFLRCEDDWGSLADNTGKLNVKFKLVAKAGTATSNR